MLVVSLLTFIHPAFAEEPDKVILPSPPQQTAPWSPPTGADAKAFPDTLIAATATLFAQGMADPRGGKYQTITVVSNSMRGVETPIETHGWVLPSKVGDKQFAVCWNGLIYPVLNIKGAANLKEDMDALGQQQENGQQKHPLGPDWAISLRVTMPEAVPLLPLHPDLIKVAYLLRLGENDLARKAYAIWETGTPPNQNGNLQIRQDPYLHLATQWTWALYDRATAAYMRGDDALALADCTLLTQIQPLVEAETAKHGYRIYPNGSAKEETAALPFLSNLAELKKDTERRIAEPPRPQRSIEAIKKLPQPERIAVLIQNLDQVNSHKQGVLWGIDNTYDPICEALVEEGDAAVEPLLDAIEKDERLTRTVNTSRRRNEKSLVRVRSTAFETFTQVTSVSQFGHLQPSIAVLREWWAKNKTLSPKDRWFAQLMQEETEREASLSPSTGDARLDQRVLETQRVRANASRWIEAANRIVQRSNEKTFGRRTRIFPLKPGQKAPPFHGEALRVRHTPSVSDLLQRRALQLSEPTEDRWGFDVANAARLALLLHEWDPKGAQTLPTLQAVMQRCLNYQRKHMQEAKSDSYQLGRPIAELSAARVALGDKAAGKEYLTWIQSVSPSLPY